MSTVKNFTLPPLSIHTQSTRPISPAQERAGRPSERKSVPPKEARRFDRDSLPSMVRATATLEPSHLKMVAFPSPTTPDKDAAHSDASSICHSPTWDDYGKKKKKEKDVEVTRKRLTKGPPPAAMDNRPSHNPRAFSDTVLSSQHVRRSVESSRSSQLLNNAPPEAPPQQDSLSIPVETVETPPKSPVFIGGVRLEREREAVLKRLMNVRTPSEERPASEATLRIEQLTDLAKKRATAPPVPSATPISYPPQSSKTPFLPPPTSPNRPRRGSIGQGLKAAAGKFFNSKDKTEQPFLKRNDSQESVKTVHSWFSSTRGRQMSGDTAAHHRGQSHDSHEREATSKEGKRGRLSLPPVSWKNKGRVRTTSMIAVPPDSARDGSFPTDGSPGVTQDNFGFLEQPFSPIANGPLSPPGSLPASMKAKMSPQMSPSPSKSPSWGPASSKRSLKEAMKSGFRSSSVTPEAMFAHQRSGTNDTLVSTEIPLPPHGHLLHSIPSAGLPAQSSPTLTSREVSSPRERHATSSNGKAQGRLDSKDSGASSSSSHPDSESQPPSPVTTPSTSRPQSSKEDKTLRIDDLKKLPLFSHDAANYTMRFPGTFSPGAETAGYSSSKTSESPRVQVNQPSSTSKTPMGRQMGLSGSNLAEDSSIGNTFMTDDLWTSSKKPTDPDQMSFTSALTSLDVKRSFTEMDAALRSPTFPNSDVEPFSLDKDHKDNSKTRVTVKKAEADGTQAPRSPAGFDFKQHFASEQASKSPKASFSPSLPQQSLPPRSNARRPSSETDQRLLASHTDSVESFARLQPPSKASAYLQEARRAAPSSPRAPMLKADNNASLLAAPGFASSPNLVLSGPAKATSTVAVPAPPLSAVAVSANIGSNSVLGKPLAKMLVECCHCRFYHDMPSRVYEAMVQPDDVVKDKRLGVSGQVTTCVKCPWCAHNMSTVCCAGYAAVVYLKEKLHGS